jgi:hypothetical protein
MASNLPLKLSWDMAQTKWASQLNPLLTNPMNNMSIIPNVQLQSGVNVINTLLGRTQQGWVLVDKQGVADIYRSAPFNNLTLTLTSSAKVLVSIGVF